MEMGDAFEIFKIVSNTLSKLISQWKTTILSRRYIFKGSMFHCYVSLPERKMQVSSDASKICKIEISLVIRT